MSATQQMDPHGRPATVVWDVDDVLNDLMRRWLEDAWLPAHPAPAVAYAELTENPPQRLLGVGLGEYLASLDAYRNSPEAAALAPVPEVAAWFAAHGDRYRHVALTARPLATMPAAAAWVYRHFGRWIRTVHLVPAERPGVELPRYDATKEEALRRLGPVDAFVDDAPQNVAGARRLGIPAVLLPRPWNGGGEIARALAALTAILEGGAAAQG